MLKLQVPWDVYLAEGTYEKCLRELKKEKLELVTAAELAEARMSAGRQHPVSKKGGFVAESYFSLPGGEILVASKEYDLISAQPKAASQWSESSYGFAPVGIGKRSTKALRERAESDPNKAIKSGVLLLQDSIDDKIPTDQFEEAPITRFLFRKHAKQYGEFLKESCYAEYGDEIEKPYLVHEAIDCNARIPSGRPLWMGNAPFSALVTTGHSSFTPINPQLFRAYGVSYEGAPRTTVRTPPGGFVGLDSIVHSESD